MLQQGYKLSITMLRCDRGPCMLLLQLAILLLTRQTFTARSRSVSPPATITASTLNSSAILLSWKAAATSTGTSISKYRLYRNSSLLVNLPGSQLTYTDGGLAASTAYRYQLRALNFLNQQSALSTGITGTTAALSTVVLWPTGTTALPIRTPSAVSGFTADATGIAFNWGFMQPGAYVQYQVSVAKDTTFKLTLSESSWDVNAGVNVYLNGVLAGQVPFKSQGSWTVYVNSDPFVLTLRAGSSTLKIQEATGIGFNLAGLNMTAGTTASSGRKGMNLGIMRLGSVVEAAAEAAILVDLGVAWARADFPWSEMEFSGPGAVQTSEHDIGVKALVAKGINVLGLIAYTPPWANGGDGQMVPPDDSQVSAFARFASYLATRYGRMGVHAWEIWNEPNIVNFWATGADPARYTKLLKAAYGAIKAADPTALVITAGLAPACTCNSNMKPQDFLLGIYAAGGKGYFDAVGMHPYTFPALPTATDGSAYWWTSMGKDLRAIMAANGDLSKTIWPTEYGAPTGGPAGSGKVSERTQAAMLTAAYNLNQDAAWAGPLFWYCLNDPGTDTSTAENFFGLLRYNKTKKPAYAALKAVQGR